MTNRRIRSERQYDILYICFLLLFSIFWFFPLLKNGSLMGDDLSFSAFTKTITLKDALLTTDASKYRPVFGFLHYLVSKIITGTYYDFFFINLIIHWINSIVLYRIGFSISQNKFRSFLISCLFISCQFSYYNVLQGLGMMEGLALFFVLEGLFFGIRYCKRNDIKDFLLVVLFSFLACFTHERYIILSIICVLLAFFSVNISWKKRIIRAAIGMIPMISNWFVKSVIFRSNFMEGTNGQSISLNIGSVIGFFAEGVADIFGINIGPEYLNGYNFLQYNTFQKILAILATILLLSGTIYVLVKAIRERQDKCRSLRLFLLFCALAGGTLIGGCVTIRLELRWVIAPFAVFLAFIAYASLAISNQKIATAWVAFITLLWIPINYVYSQNLGNVFFIRSMKIANQTYQGTVQKYGESLADSEVYIISNDEADWADGLQPWQKTSIFDVHMDRHVTVHSIRSIDDIDNKNENIKVFRVNDDCSVSEEYYLPAHETILDMNKNGNITVNPDSPAATPSGKGVLIYNDALTVLSGYSAISEKTDIPDGTELLLSASIPYEGSDGAYVIIYLQNDDTKYVIYEDDLYPNQPIIHQLIKVETSMDQAELCAEVSSPTGNADMDWVILEECCLVQKE